MHEPWKPGLWVIGRICRGVGTPMERYCAVYTEGNQMMLPLWASQKEAVIEADRILSRLLAV